MPLPLPLPLPLLLLGTELIGKRGLAAHLSQIHETFQEVQYTAIPFDDRKVADELLQAKSLAK